MCLDIAHGGLLVNQQTQNMTMLSAFRTDLTRQINSFRAT